MRKQQICSVQAKALGAKYSDTHRILLLDDDLILIYLKA